MGGLDPRKLVDQSSNKWYCVVGVVVVVVAVSDTTCARADKRLYHRPLLLLFLPRAQRQAETIYSWIISDFDRLYCTACKCSTAYCIYSITPLICCTRLAPIESYRAGDQVTCMCTSDKKASPMGDELTPINIYDQPRRVDTRDLVVTVETNIDIALLICWKIWSWAWDDPGFLGINIMLIMMISLSNERTRIGA